MSLFRETPKEVAQRGRSDLAKGGKGDRKAIILWRQGEGKKRKVKEGNCQYMETWERWDKERKYRHPRSAATHYWTTAKHFNS